MARPRKGSFDEATATRVLRAAEQIFGASGYRDARLEDIAAAAGIRRSSLLYHFESKDKLYREVVARAFVEIRGAMARGMAQGTTYEQRLDATVASLLELEAVHRPLLTVVLRELLDPRAPSQERVASEFVPMVDALERFLVSLGGDQIAPGVPVRAAIMQLIISHLARAAMGDLGEVLWGGSNQTHALTRALFAARPAPSEVS